VVPHRCALVKKRRRKKMHIYTIGFFVFFVLFFVILFVVVIVHIIIYMLKSIIYTVFPFRYSSREITAHAQGLWCCISSTLTSKCIPIQYYIQYKLRRCDTYPRSLLSHLPHLLYLLLSVKWVYLINIILQAVNCNTILLCIQHALVILMLLSSLCVLLYYK